MTKTVQKAVPKTTRGVPNPDPHSGRLRIKPTPTQMKELAKLKKSIGIGETIVYRMENKKGEGPFTGRDWSNRVHPDDFVYFIDHSDMFPEPQSEGISERMMNTGLYKCGCISLEQFDDWFGPVYKMLQSVGFSMVVYVTKKRYAKFGEMQVVFNPDRSKKVMRL